MTPELTNQLDQSPPPGLLPNRIRPEARYAPLPVIAQDVAIGLRRALPITEARPPTMLTCLQCQLLGRRRMLCSKADLCAELPHSFAVGPILLGAWLVTAIAFIVAVL